MRSWHARRWHVVGATALGLAALAAPASATGTPEQNGLPPPVAINWPPQAPADALPSPSAAPVEPPKTVEPSKLDATPSIAVPQAAAPTQPAAAAAQKFTLGPDLVARLKAQRLADAKARADRDAAAKFYEARDGAPIWVFEQGFTPAALALMNEINAADSYGLQASVFKLPSETWTGQPASTQLIDAEMALTAAALHYARHARGDRLDPLSLSKMLDRKAQVLEPASVLTALAAAAKPDEYIRSLHPAHPQFERLRLKYLAARSGQLATAPAPADEPVAKSKKGKKVSVPAPPLTNSQLERKLLANMEMYRWMPDMGDTYIVNNIPEFTTRVVRDGKIVHSERIVTGKQETPTPIFSDAMSLVVFKPFWNVPESIKWKELQPQLARNSSSLARAGLRAAYNGKEIDPSTVDWTSTDLRAFHVFQPPGASNALGVVKFMFPNKHDVYMHDTPQKSLFDNGNRAYSHGCVRVRDPLKFAEVILGHDKGLTRAQINQLASSGPENNEVKLTRKVPVHITYFTTVVDDDGNLKLFNDIYGHEKKIHLGFEGKQHLIEEPRIVAEKAPPRTGNGVVLRREREREWERPRQSSSDPDWMRRVFNGI